MKTSSSERVTNNSATAGKDGTATEITPSNSINKPPSRCLPAKRASPYWYIKKPVTTVLEGDIWGRIPALSANPENIQSTRSGAGCHGGIIGVAGNGGGGWYFSPPDPEDSGGGKGERNRVRKSTEDLVDIILWPLEGGTGMHEGKGGCLIMVDEEKYGDDSNRHNRRLLMGPDLVRYSSHLSSSN